MKREEWLKKIRAQAELLYDHIAPGYWVTFGQYDNVMHRQFIEKFLGRLAEHSTLLDAGCGAGRYDGLLLEGGHTVLGIDQSGSMLAQAREHYPQEGYPGLRYAKVGLQEMDFQGEFDGVVCIDAMEHVFPEDWPTILARLHKALKPGGVLYMTVEGAEGEGDEVGKAYERAIAQGLPVVPGEIVDELDAAYTQVMAQDWQTGGEQSDKAVYHFLPTLDQARAWFSQAGFTIEEEETGKWYTHFLARKNK